MIKDIEFIYFDIGGVLIDDFSENNKHQEMTDDLGISREDSREVWERYEEFAAGIDAGKITTDQLQEKIFSHFNVQAPEGYNMLKDFVDRFGLNVHIHSVARMAREHFQVGLLTNMYIGMLDMINERGLLPGVAWDTVVDSSVVGLAKPQREIYERAEKEAGTSGDKIFFIDNREENLEVPKELGWQTFLYDSADYERSSRELAEVLGV